MLFMWNHAPAVLIFPTNSLLLQAFPNSSAAANDSILDNIPIFFLFLVNQGYREAGHALAVLRVIPTVKSIVTMAAEKRSKQSGDNNSRGSFEQTVYVSYCNCSPTFRHF